MAALPPKATQYDRDRPEKRPTPRRRQPVWCNGWKNTGGPTAFALRTTVAGSSYTHPNGTGLVSEVREDMMANLLRLMGQLDAKEQKSWVGFTKD